MSKNQWADLMNILIAGVVVLAFYWIKRWKESRGNRK